MCLRLLKHRNGKFALRHMLKAVCVLHEGCRAVSTLLTSAAVSICLTCFQNITQRIAAQLSADRKQNRNKPFYSVTRRNHARDNQSGSVPRFDSSQVQPGFEPDMMQVDSATKLSFGSSEVVPVKLTSMFPSVQPKESHAAATQGTSH